MPTIKTSFEGPERLWQTLEILVNEYSSRIVRISITRGTVVAELDQEVELPGFGYDDLWRQLRQCRVTSFDYAGSFSIAVMKSIYRQIKSEGLSPVYLLIHPSSLFKKTRDWLDLSIITGVGSTFMGLVVVESESIDDDAFVVAAGHSPKASVHNIVMGVKGVINEPL